MAPVTNGRLLFNEVPSGYPVPGKTTIYDTSQTIDLESVPLSGSVLVKVLLISVDPYMRGKMRSPEIKSYSSAFILNKPLNGFAVGKILRSENSSFKAGEYVYGMLDFAQYFIPKDASKELRVVVKEAELPLSVYVGVAGMPGQTAYFGWKEYSKAKAGETVFISTAAGPVGSIVLQLAKQAGCKVIASTGSDEKVQFCKDIGADVAFNYKTTDTKEVLAKEGPIDVYWDHVGGPTLEAAIENAALHARIIICGYISQYNNEEAYGIKNLNLVLSNRLAINGLLIWDHYSKYAEEFYSEFPKKLAKGELKYTEDFTKGLENAGDAILEVQKGLNKGKKVVIIAEDD